MLRLRAAAWEDGYAVVESDGALFMIRPPYRQVNKVAVPESDLESAVAKHGFSATDQSFEDWAALIEHLKRRFIEERKGQGQVPDSARIKKLIERVPAYIVASYLDRIEDELLPQKQWRAANGVLAHLLRNPVVRQDPGLLDRVSVLLERVELESDPDAPALKKAVPSADPETEKLARLIREDHQVWPMGSAA
jgi:hypothetical protein